MELAPHLLKVRFAQKHPFHRLNAGLHLRFAVYHRICPRGCWRSSRRGQQDGNADRKHGSRETTTLQTLTCSVAHGKRTACTYPLLLPFTHLRTRGVRADQAKAGRVALLIAHENITNGVYTGNDKSLLVANVLFKLGGSAAVLSTRCAALLQVVVG